MWGSKTWKSIHSLAHENDKRKHTSKSVEIFQKFLLGLRDVLPCPKCRHHMVSYMKRNPVKKPFFDWTVHFHNDVNKRLDKPQLSIESALKELKKNDCVSKRDSVIVLGIGSAAILILLVSSLIVLFSKKHED